jgi:hypothetical protein
MYQHYQAGHFGNKFHTWDDIPHWLASAYRKPVCMRYKGAMAGGKCAYHVAPESVCDVDNEWAQQGLDPKLITINESADDTALTIQGEVMRSTRHLSLRYSQTPLPMRNALAASERHAEGLEATCILKTYLDPASYEDLMDLLDTYEDAVVEFSTYSVDVGRCPRRNTVVWEARNY